MYSRTQLANKTLDTLRRGPSFWTPMTKAQREEYDRWFRSWVETQLVVLIPELAKDPKNADLFNGGRELLNRRPARMQTIEEQMMDDAEIAQGVQ